MDLTRRSFLETLAGGAIALPGACRLGHRAAAANPSRRKLLLVLFGGGTRSLETVDDPEHRYIPHLWRELVPRGALFTNLRVEGKVVHPNSAGSIATGHWEYDDLDWSRPVAHPTLFEIYRKAAGAPDTKTWAFVYASILAGMGESRDPGFGGAYGANVVEPPTLPRWAAEEMDQRLRWAAAKGSPNSEISALKDSARLAREASRLATGGLRSATARAFVEAGYAAWKAGRGTTSHDAFLVEQALACMRAFAPDVLAIALGEIDCAHYGSWSRYVEAIRRTDALVGRLWRAMQGLAAYRDQTLVLILPDHGRELERSGGSGFIHHSDFYTGAGVDEGCRRVWMLALGPGIRRGGRIEAPVPITAVAATGLEFLGLGASPGAERSVLSRIRSG